MFEFIRNDAINRGAVKIYSQIHAKMLSVKSCIGSEHQASDHTYVEFVVAIANQTQSINVNCINIQASRTIYTLKLN